MKIETIELKGIQQNGFNLSDQINPKNNWEVIITASLEGLGNERFLEYIEIQIIRRTIKKTAAIKVTNVFEIVNKDNNFIPKTDFDFWLYADLY